MSARCQILVVTTSLTEGHKIILKHERLMSWVVSENVLVVRAGPRLVL